MKRAIGLAAALWLVAAPSSAAPAGRIVTLGGDVTEIVFALGQQGRIVCDDQTSLYPAAATKLPQVGYLRTLAAEGVLSCKPDLILASEDAGPPAAMTQLGTTGIPIVHVPNAHSADAVPAKIAIIAEALGVADRGKALQDRYRTALAGVKVRLAAFRDHPRAVFLMAQGPGGAMAAGRDTAADVMLTLAGAQNVASGFSGYKPLTPEAAIDLKPDVIIVADHAVRMLGGIESLRARPEIAMTPAGQSGRIVAMDALLLLGFGPRTPDALAALAAALHAPAIATLH
ncbi:MAG: ABC transporter substrate-binding protein [Rhizomicrobium sp.]